MKNKAILFLVAAVLLSCTSAYAASPWTEKANYKEKVLGKLDFGFKNTFGGWTELINRPIKHHKEGKAVAEGVLVGIGNTLVYTGGGILHLVTFPIPAVDIPLPNNGVSFE